MYRSMPPLTMYTPSVWRSSPACCIWSNKAEALSHRIPPVQYIITFLPDSFALVSGALSHFGNS
eukprot:7225574-Pyramimonas_sp.AAC.1